MNISNREGEKLAKTVKIRKLSYCGDVMRHPEKNFILQLVIQVKIVERRGPGRIRTSWLKNMRQWYGKSTVPSGGEQSHDSYYDSYHDSQCSLSEYGTRRRRKSDAN